MTETADAVVIGAGHNGLVAANMLADAGWDVVVLEATGAIGGAVRSAEVTAPGFVNDLYSAFYPLAVASPALAALDLPAHGLRWTHAPAVAAHILPDGRAVVLDRDVDVTAGSVEAFSPGDGQRWSDTYREWQDVSEQAGPSRGRRRRTGTGALPQPGRRRAPAGTAADRARRLPMGQRDRQGRLGAVQHAPGFRDLVLARHAALPDDLQRDDPSLDRGAINGGTAAVHQQLIFRPVPGLGRADTPSTGCTSPAPAPTPAAACTAPRGPTPPARRSPVTGRCWASFTGTP